MIAPMSVVYIQNGDTALIFATRKTDADVVMRLLEYNAQVDLQNQVCFVRIVIKL